MHSMSAAIFASVLNSVKHVLIIFELCERLMWRSLWFSIIGFHDEFQVRSWLFLHYIGASYALWQFWYYAFITVILLVCDLLFFRFLLFIMQILDFSTLLKSSIFLFIFMIIFLNSIISQNVVEICWMQIRLVFYIFWTVFYLFKCIH